jgi:hypothetical protein
MLAQTRLREGGHLVLGFGEEKTPLAFVASCDEFVYTRALMGDGSGRDKVEPNKIRTKQNAETDSPPTESKKTQKKLGKLVAQAIAEGTSQKGGERVTMSTIADNIRLQCPNFKDRTYGFTSISKLVRTLSDKVEVGHKGRQSTARAKPSKR